MRMLLVARTGRARDRFVEELGRLGAAYDVAATPGELAECVRCGRFSGVLFDVPTLLREKAFDKRLLHALAEIYPSARLKYDAATDCVHALGAGAGPASRDGLSVFVAACRDFLPRRLRRGARVDVHLPVVLRPALPDGQGEGERTCTLNISFSGCFVFSVGEWAVGDPCRVEFPGVADGRLGARVAWREPWGRRRAIPGIGLAFLEMPRAFAEELGRLGCVADELEVASPAKGL